MKWLNIVELWKKHINNSLNLIIKNHLNIHKPRETYIKEKYRKKIYNIIRISKCCKKCLVIGSYTGYLPLLILLSNKNISIDVIDECRYNYVEPIINNLKQFGNITLIKGKTTDVLHKIKDKYDFIHIDGGETSDQLWKNGAGLFSFEVLKQEIEHSIRLLSLQGTLVVNDTLYEFLRPLWIKTMNLYKLKLCNNKKLQNTFFHKIYTRDEDSLNVCFYTLFIGSNRNVSNVIRKIPSHVFPCYFYSNDKETLKKAKKLNWIPVEIDDQTIISKQHYLDSFEFVFDDTIDSYIKSTKLSKYFKCQAHLLSQISKYDYSVYLDSKLILENHDLVVKSIRNMKKKGLCYVLKNHPYIKDTVWNEYNEAILFDRYKHEKEKMKKYIHNQIKKGLSSNIITEFFQTGFIIRDHTNPKTSEINDKWYTDVIKCGCECQISLFFIQQQYSKYISSIPFQPEISLQRLY